MPHHQGRDGRDGMTGPIGPVGPAGDPLLDYRVGKLEEVTALLSSNLDRLVTEIQRAKWVVGGAYLFSQHREIAHVLKLLGGA